MCCWWWHRRSRGGVDGARAEGRRAHTGTAGEAAEDLRHERRRLFVADQDVPDGRPGQGVSEVDVLLARDAELTAATRSSNSPRPTCDCCPESDGTDSAARDSHERGTLVALGAQGHDPASTGVARYEEGVSGRIDLGARLGPALTGRIGVATRGVLASHTHRTSCCDRRHIVIILAASDRRGTHAVRRTAHQVHP